MSEACEWCGSTAFHNREDCRRVAERAAETIKVRVRVCECGARYATPGVARMHKCKLGGAGSFRTVTETRPKPESRISYQPGYGPTVQS